MLEIDKINKYKDAIGQLELEISELQGISNLDSNKDFQLLCEKYEQMIKRHLEDIVNLDVTDRKKWDEKHSDGVRLRIHEIQLMKGYIQASKNAIEIIQDKNNTINKLKTDIEKAEKKEKSKTLYY